MTKAKELITNTIIIGIGSFGTKILTFLLLPLYTTCLSTSEYGQFDLLLTVASFVVPFVTLLMEESMFRFLIDCKTENDKKNVITQSLALISINAIIFTLLFVVLCVFIRFDYQWLFYGMVISNIIVAVRNAYLRGVGKIRQYALLNFVSSLIMIGTNILLIAILKYGVSSLFISHIIIGAISFLILIPTLLGKVQIKNIKKSDVRKMLKYSLPLVPNSISWAVINTSDRFVVASNIGASANGIYSISNKFPTVVDTVYGFFYTAWKESAAKTLSSKDRDIFYNQVYSGIKNAMLAVVIVIICFMPLVFNVLVKNEFVEAYLYIPLLTVSILFANLSGFYGGIFTAVKDTKIMGTTTIAAAVINISIDLLLINSVGLWAAAISTIISTFFMYIYRRIAVRKYVILKDSFARTCLDIAMIAIAVIGYYCAAPIVRCLAIIVCSCYCIYINRKIPKIFLSKKKGARNEY